MTTTQVLLLNNKTVAIELEKNVDGLDLFNAVCSAANLREREYFGLTYSDASKQSSWLKLDKSLKKQLGGHWQCELRFRFYPPQPRDLKDDLTRYHLFLQVGRDLADGRLPTNFEEYVQLGALTVRSELGEYNSAIHHGNYVSKIALAPPMEQTTELEGRVVQTHQNLPTGLRDSEIELEYLSIARKLPLYGVTLFSVSRADSTALKLGVSAIGLREYEKGSFEKPAATYSWPHVLKLSYRRSTFYVDVRLNYKKDDEEQRTLSYSCVNGDAAKRLWKTCVEHHEFFRGQPKTASEESLFRRRQSFRRKSPASPAGAASPTQVVTQVRRSDAIPAKPPREKETASSTEETEQLLLPLLLPEEPFDDKENQQTGKKLKVPVLEKPLQDTRRVPSLPDSPPIDEDDRLRKAIQNATDMSGNLLVEGIGASGSKQMFSTQETKVVKDDSGDTKVTTTTVTNHLVTRKVTTHDAVIDLGGPYDRRERVNDDEEAARNAMFASVNAVLSKNRSKTVTKTVLETNVNGQTTQHLEESSVVSSGDEYDESELAKAIQRVTGLNPHVTVNEIVKPEHENLL